MVGYLKRNGLGWLSLLLISLMLLQLLAGCDTPDAGAGGEESTAESTTEAETEEEEVYSEILVSELSKYRIIYREDGTEEELAQVIALQGALYNAYGVLLDARDDFVREGTSLVESEYEIIVGRCARDAAIGFCRDFRSEDYGYCVLGKQLVIAGATSDATALAVEAFISDVVGREGDVLLSTEETVAVRGDYDLPSAFLNGAELCEYTIVYPQGNERMRSVAEYLADAFWRTLSYLPLVRSDATPASGAEILVGETSRGVSGEHAENEYSIVANEHAVTLAGGSATMVYRAADDLVGRLKGAYSGKPGEEILLSLSEPVRVTCEISTLRAMSFNIRCAEFTEERIALVFRMIDLYAPDTIGFQEATVAWMNRLKNYLGDDYGCVGVGRNADHSGEASPVFYLKSKFKVLESGTRWMCSTPDVPGSKVPESSLPRVYSYAVLEVIGTGATFVHVNTHLEHTSEEARKIQAEYLTEFLEQYRDAGMSYIVSGDFNCQRGAGSYNVMIGAGLSDALYVADEAHSGTTYHGYGKTDKVIDHIFVSEGISVPYYKACTETFKGSDGKIAYPSDHNPVVIDYKIS